MLIFLARNINNQTHIHRLSDPNDVENNKPDAQFHDKINDNKYVILRHQIGDYYTLLPFFEVHGVESNGMRLDFYKDTDRGQYGLVHKDDIEIIEEYHLPWDITTTKGYVIEGIFYQANVYSMRIEEDTTGSIKSVHVTILNKGEFTHRYCVSIDVLKNSAIIPDDVYRIKKGNQYIGDNNYFNNALIYTKYIELSLVYTDAEKLARVLLSIINNYRIPIEEFFSKNNITVENNKGFTTDFIIVLVKLLIMSKKTRIFFNQVYDVITKYEPNRTLYAIVSDKTSKVITFENDSEMTLHMLMNSNPTNTIYRIRE